MISGSEERIALIIILTVIVIISAFAMFMENSGINMFAVSFSEDAGSGTLVKISGFAEDVICTQSGGHMTASVNRVKVFIPADISHPGITEGDYITVIGIVDEFMDEMEIKAIKINKFEKSD